MSGAQPTGDRGGGRHGLRGSCGTLSHRLNVAVEAIVALLMLLLLLDVWLGVTDRYVLGLQLPWPETLARYLMIWAALLAVSSGIARREHIGLGMLVERLPRPLRRAALLFTDALALALFCYLFYYGVGFGASGFEREAMIFGMSLGPAYSAIPAAAFVCALQMLLVLIRDAGEQTMRADAALTIDEARS